MTASKLALLLAGIVLATTLTVAAWQQTRINHLAVENTRLQTTTTDGQNVEKPQPPPDAAGLPELQAEHEQLTAEIVQLRAAVAAAAEKKASSPPNSNDKSSMAERAAHYRVNLMKGRISLNPEQEDKILAIIKQHIEAEAQAEKKTSRSGPTEADMAWRKQAKADAETEINALLSPEQQTAYQKFKADEVNMQARSMATSEVGGMQHEVNLTEAQQDQVFRVFCDLAHKQMDGETIGTEKLINALSGILTAHQTELYRAYLSPTNSRGGTSLTLP